MKFYTCTINPLTNLSLSCSFHHSVSKAKVLYHAWPGGALPPTTVQQHLEKVRNIHLLVEGGFSQQKAARTWGVNQKSMQAWDAKYDHILALSNKACLAMKDGPNSQLKPIENDIL